MFGTIGHARPKPGTEAQFTALMVEWKLTVRPRIAGGMLELTGTVKDRPGEVVFIALMQSEATYRNLANDPDQDAWYRRLMEMIDGEITWEDVEMEITLQD